MLSAQSIEEGISTSKGENGIESLNLEAFGAVNVKLPKKSGRASVKFGFLNPKSAGKISGSLRPDLTPNTQPESNGDGGI